MTPGMAAVFGRPRPSDQLLKRILTNEARPCAGDMGYTWTSETEADRAYAMAACGHCPVIGLCREVAQADKPSAGVWAGLDFQVADRPDSRAFGVAAYQSSPSSSRISVSSPVTSGSARRKPRKPCRTADCTSRAVRLGLCGSCYREMETGVVVRRNNERGTALELALDAVACGRSASEVAGILNVKVTTLERHLQRAGRHDLWSQLRKVSP